jgi:hypothetical protein
MILISFYITAILEAVVCSLFKVSVSHRVQLPFLPYIMNAVMRCFLGIRL